MDMKDFLQKLKKFLKIAVIVVLVIVASLALYGAYDYQQRQVANTVDQEIGFKCDVDNTKRTVQFILISTPNSRDRDGFYTGALVPQYESSTESDTTNAKLVFWQLRQKTIDFIVLQSANDNGTFRLNRKTFELLISTEIRASDYENTVSPMRTSRTTRNKRQCERKQCKS